MRKRILAIVMAVCMMLSVLPTSAFADEEQTEESSGIVYGTYDEDGTWTEDTDSTGTVTDGNYMLSKTAEATGNPNEFEITLTVTTTTTSTTTAAAAAATVLVIDVSGSMNYCAECGGNGSHNDGCSNSGSVTTAQTRIYAAKQAAISFLQSYSGLEFNTDGTLKSTADLSLGRYVSLVTFSSGVTAYAWVDVSNPSGYTTVLGYINALSATGGTNLHAGLLQADYQLTLDAVTGIASTQKNVIVLTDGAPTYYLTTTNRGGDITIGGTSYRTSGSGSSTTTSETTAAANAAATLKQSASVYTVCFGVADNKLYSSGNDTTTIGEFLSNSIATAATEGKTYAYNASNATELYAAFAAITETITGELAAMTVTDPMGDNVTATLDSSSTDAVLDEDGTITWTLSSATVEETTEGDTTTYTYTYTYTYTVTVDTSSISDGSQTFPLNDATYLTVGEEEYHFPVPAVDGSVLYYTVTYEDGEHGSLSYDTSTSPTSESSDTVVYANLAYGSDTPAAPEVTADEGYYFTGWEPTVENTVTGSVTYVAQYAEKTALTITIANRNVEYTGSAQSGYGYVASGDGVSTVTGLKDGHSISTVTGYTEATGTDVGIYNNGSWADNYSVVIVDEEGNNVTEQYTIAVNPGKLTITNNTTDLAVTAENVIVVYDGEAHGVTGTATVDGVETTAATITYVYTDSEGNELDSEPVNVGTYTVTVTASLAGYSDATTTATVTITKRPVDGEKVEQWESKIADRDWAALEKTWSTANSAPGGEAMD